MDEALWEPAAENRDSPVKVKVEDSAWEQMCRTQEHASHAQELCRLRFRRFSFQEVTGPQEALARLHELCRLWLRPETHSKEQMLELLVLEQFLRILPARLRARVRERRPQSGEEAVAALEDAGPDTGDMAQQASVYTQGQDTHLLATDRQGASLECRSLHLLPGVTTVKCEPPEFPDKNVQAMSLSARVRAPERKIGDAGDSDMPERSEKGKPPPPHEALDVLFSCRSLKEGGSPMVLGAGEGFRGGGSLCGGGWKGPAPQGPAPLLEKAPRHKAPALELKSATPQTSVKTEEEAAQTLVPEEWPHLRLAQRNLCGDSAQEATGLCLRTEEVVTKDELFNAKQEASEELDQGAEASGIPERDRVPQVACGTPGTNARTAARLNTVKHRHPGDLWARMHVSSLEYAAGDITRKGRKKDKARVSELLQGLAFSGDSDVEDNSEPEAQPAPKKLKALSVPERTWAQRDIRPSFPSWSVLDSGLLNLKSEKLSPVELFELFFDDETFNLIVSETNKYASQKDVSLEVTVQEMRCVFGVLLWSGIVRRPRRGMYWEVSDAGQSQVRESITRDRFELIFSYLHFADSSRLDPKDKFTKLRPLIKQMNKNFLLYAPLQEYYCFDRTMCECFDSGPSLNGRPVRIGYKMWCGTTTQGYLVWFEPHQEESTMTADKNLDLGLGGNLVMRFADALLERGQHPYHLCFDSFFTSVKLVSALKKKGVRATGTIRESRMEKCPLMNAAHMKTMKKGYFDFRVEENEEILLCRWHGDGVSSLCSSTVGIEPVGEVSCFEDDEISRINRPSIVKLYDECREGVANMDQIISKYRVRIRSKKWYSVLVSFMVDVAINNAWQLHRACNPGASLDLSDFRRRVAHAYLEPSAGLSGQGR